MFPNNGSLAKNHTEMGYNLVGNKTRSQRPFSPYSANIEKCCNDIEQNAAQTNSTIDRIITNILAQSVDQLNIYALSKNESPDKNLLSLITQCAVLRMQDIGKIASSLDTTDDDASLILENSEYDSISKKKKNAKAIPDALVAACLSKVIERIVSNNINAGGSGSCAEICASLRENQYNGFIRSSEIVMSNGPEIYNNYSDLNIDGGQRYELTSQSEDAVDSPSPAPNVALLPSENTSDINGTNSGGIFGFIDKAISSIKNAAGAVSSVGNSVGNTIDNIKDKASNAAGDIAAGAFKDAIVKNIPLILGTVVAIVAIILIMVYAAKNSNR